MDSDRVGFVRDRRSTHPAIKWLGKAGFGGLVLGFAGVFLTEWYWPAVSCLYLSCVLILLDLCFGENQLSAWWRVGIAIGIAAFVVWFTLKFVFVESPLEVSALSDMAEQQQKEVGGIRWRQEYVELDVYIKNSTAHAYSDLDIIIRPDFPIVSIKQTDGPPVRFESRGLNDLHQVVKMPAQPTKENPLVLVATDAGYRVRCARLVGGESISLIAALADIRWNPHPNSKGQMAGFFDPDYILKLHSSEDFGNYWYGHKDFDYFTPRSGTTPTWMTVDESYTVLYRRRNVSNKRIDIVHGP